MGVVEQIRKKIAEQGKAEEVVELDLTGISIGKFTPQIKELIQKCKQLEILILAGCELTSLENLPTADLTALDLSENKLNDADLANLSVYKDLGQILLNGNNIKSVDSLKVFTTFANLQEVDFSDNPVASEKTYRDYLFTNIPSIEVVDRKDKDGNDVLEEEEFEGDEDDEDEEDFEGADDDGDDDFEDESDQESDKPKKKHK